MRTAGVAFVLACLVSALLTPVVRRFALKHHLFDDNVASRKVHGRPTPRLGGIAIAAGFYVPLLALLFEASGVGGIFYANSHRAIAFLVGGVAICALGLYDDIRGSGAVKKFIAQFAIAGALYWFGFRIDVLSLPFVGTVSLGSLSLLFTLLWIVGVINALNLIDGLDGLAAGVGLFGVATTFVMSASRNDPIMMLFMAGLGGSLLGFLIYQFQSGFDLHGRHGLDVHWLRPGRGLDPDQPEIVDRRGHPGSHRGARSAYRRHPAGHDPPRRPPPAHVQRRPRSHPSQIDGPRSDPEAGRAHPLCHQHPAWWHCPAADRGQ